MRLAPGSFARRSPRPAARCALLALLVVVSAVVGSAASGQSRRLSADLALTPGKGRVVEYEHSADGAWVVYRVDQTRDEEFELYTRPADRSLPPRRVHGPLPQHGDVDAFALGERIVFLGDVVRDGARELFSSPLDAATPPLRLHPELPAGEHVASFRLSPAGSHAVFTAGPVFAERLFAVPIDGASAPVELAPGAGRCEDMLVSPDGLRVVGLFYDSADEDWSLWSQPIDASSPAVALDEAGGPLGAIVFSPGGTRVVYRETIFCGGGPYCVRNRSVPADGSGPAVELDGGASASNPERHFFSDDQRMLAVGNGLNVVPLDGSPALRLDVPDPQVFVRYAALSPDESTAIFASARVPNVNARFLYRVPVDGSEAPTPIPGPWNSILRPMRVSPDSATAVLIDAFGSTQRLQAVALGTLSHTELATSLSEDPERAGIDVRFLAGGTALVFDADAIPAGLFQPRASELYRSALDGSQPALRLDDGAGDVFDFALTPDEASVLHLSWDEELGTSLVAVPSAGGASGTYNDPLPGGPPVEGDVTHFRASADGRVLVYRADVEEDERFELLAVRPADPGGPRRLSPLVAAGDDVAPEFTLSASGSHVAFWTGSDSVYDLWCARTDGATPPRRLDSVSLFVDSPPPLLFTDDGLRLVYRPGNFRFASVRIDGSEARRTFGPVNLVVQSLELAPRGRVLAHGAIGTRGVLYSAPVDGSELAVSLVPSLTSQQVRSPCPTSDGRVLYLSDPVDEVFELFSVPIEGSEPPKTLSPLLAANRDVTDFALSADGSVVVLRADLGVDDVFELHRLVGPGQTKPLTPLPAFADVEPDFVLDLKTASVTFRADLTANERFDLLRVPLDASRPPLTLATPLFSGTDVIHFRVSPSGTQVAFAAATSPSATSYNLYRATPAGGSGVLLAGAVASYAITPDSHHVVFTTANSFNPTRLRAAPFSGGPTLILEATPVSGSQGGSIPAFHLAPGGRVFYLADGETWDVLELWQASTSPVRVAAPAR